MAPHTDDIPDYGDYVGPEDEVDVEELAEPFERYQPGLYYPVRIGEVLAGTYRIEHKLGHGGFSTVWMARDIKTQRDVALKIMVADEVGENELNFHKKIIETVQDTSNLLLYSSTFFLRGCDCEHRVLVLPVLGPNLGSWKYLDEMPIARRMSAAKQLLKALESLHAAGIVHRDLNSGSAMWGLASVDILHTHDKYKVLGRPQKILFPPVTWKEGELVKPMEPLLSLLTDTIYLGDFGLAIEAGTQVNFQVQSPPAYCAPERFHNISPSFASDMWSYMCIFLELCISFHPFRCFGNASLVDDLVDAFGPLPEQWKGHYNAPGNPPNESWYDQSRAPQPTRSTRRRIERALPHISSKERDLILSILFKGLCYLPEDRITATQLLQDASFRALMEIYGC